MFTGIVTSTGELPKVALLIAEKPLKAGLPTEILYWLGEPVVVEKGKLKLVALLQISATLPKVIVGKAFTVTVTGVRVLSQVVLLLYTLK